MGRSGENFISLLNNENISIFSVFDDFSSYKGKIINENLFPKICKNIKKCVFMEQIHSNKVEFLKENNQKYICDGLISDEKNVALCVLSADCIPLLLYGEKYIGALHSGRIGSFLNILNEYLKKASENSNLYIGPGICQEHYEINGELLELCKKDYNIFLKNDKLDLKSLIKTQAKNSSIKTIYDCEICTYENTFSYRKDKTSKRIVSVIVRKN